MKSAYVYTWCVCVCLAGRRPHPHTDTHTSTHAHEYALARQILTYVQSTLVILAATKTATLRPAQICSTYYNIHIYPVTSIHPSINTSYSKQLQPSVSAPGLSSRGENQNLNQRRRWRCLWLARMHACLSDRPEPIDRSVCARTVSA